MKARARDACVTSTGLGFRGGSEASREQWGAVGSSQEQWGAVGSSGEQSGAVRSSRRVSRSLGVSAPEPQTEELTIVRVRVRGRPHTGEHALDQHPLHTISSPRRPLCVHVCGCVCALAYSIAY